jgi:hypothetical protein
VKAKLNIEWYKMKPPKNKSKLKIEKLRQAEEREKYQEKVKSGLEEMQSSNVQDKWKIITKICTEAAEEVVGRNDRNNKRENEEIKDLSEKQKKIRDEINSTRNKNTRKEKRIERNKIMTEIHKKIEEEDQKAILEMVEEVENSKDDSRRMFKVVKNLQRIKEKKKIVVDGENGKTTDESQQVKIVTSFFSQMFNKATEEQIEKITPVPMTTPFSKEEIKKAAKSLKNGKSAGIDEIQGELIKYAPEEIFEEIAEIFNDIAVTGNYPQEIKEGVLVPLQKPGKKAGPPGNLRPIILLSIVRKILAICMLRRCLQKLLKKIPATQAAYQAGRSTTEQVFSFKILAEKAITSNDYTIILLLLDMSKAFDTVRRSDLMKTLKTVLDKDELHMIKILIEDVILKVRIGGKTGEEIKTNIGVPQGDCLSPILFIIYLAEALKPTHGIAVPPFIEDHRYTKYSNKLLMIDQQYADDISWITNNEARKRALKEEVPKIIREKNLQANNTKTEEYTINREGDGSWRSCKYLGSLLDTKKDINRRKILAIAAYNQLKKILESRKVSKEVKIRLFRSHIESIFLYNCELWTTTKQLINEIDVFQRNMLRKIMEIQWQDRITNNQLYERTKVTPWSKTVKKRRLKWYGHLLRLPEETPARAALREARRYVQKPRGGQKITWLKLIDKDLENINIKVAVVNGDGTNHRYEICNHEILAKNRHIWQVVVNRAMSLEDGRA